MAMKGETKSRIFSKGGVGIDSLCVLEVVEGLSVEGAYSRMGAWEEGPTYKDLDWLFRPLGWTKTQCRMILGMDDSFRFRKGSDVVTIRCVMDIVGITSPAAFTRCNKWKTTDWDLDWLFRPSFPNKDTSKFKKAKAPKNRYTEGSYTPEDATYEEMLRKHLGLRG